MASVFKPIKQIDETITSQDEFNNSMFLGSEALLGVDDYNKCLFASDADDDFVNELFYFLEGNSEIIEHDGNMSLHELDSVKFVLIDDNERNSIVILKKDREEIENFV